MVRDWPIVAFLFSEAPKGLVAERRPAMPFLFEKLALTAHDAASRMELVDHDFYFFTNIETGNAAVVYRRRDGGVGLIDEA